jgi:hypothetical protein
VEAWVIAVRPKVLWWGIDPPPDICRELRNRELEIVPTEDEHAVEDPDVRALLLPSYPGKGVAAITTRAKRLREPIIDRGGSVFVVTFGRQTQDAVIQTSGLEIGVLDAGDATEVAQACARVAPGRPVGDVTVERVGRTKLSRRDELLLKRAFGEYSSIEVTALTGGLSGASVWSVHATTRHGRRTNPFLVKADTIKDITTEIDTVRYFVRDHIPFTNCPPLHDERSVSGLGRRLLVSDFVERAERFDDYLARGGSVEKVVRSIFDGPLRNWRGNATRSNVDVGKDYVRRIRGPEGKHDAALAKAHELAVAIDPILPAPTALLALIERFGVRDLRQCQAHGDLHPRNIFVRDNSEEIILIDFAKAGDLGSPYVRDAATLDVALAFDGWERFATRVAPDEIETLYAPRLYDLNAHGLTHRARAVFHVRQQAKVDAADEHEYTIAITAMLLRTARLLANSDGDADMRRRLIATAIRCAEHLAKTLP